MDSLTEVVLNHEKRIATLEAILSDLIYNYYEQDAFVVRMLLDLKVELLTHNKKSPYSRLKHIEQQFSGLINYFNLKLDGKPQRKKVYNTYD